MQRQATAMGVLVGGGPAPGINGVIRAATLAAHARGWRVLGFREGFRHLMAGKPEANELAPADVEGIGRRGGSMLFTSRANPAREPQGVERVLASLQALGVTRLVTIGGDDTATSAVRIARASQGAMGVAHVPKTIDNDLPLPGGEPTFGFRTAQELGSRLVANLREDARTTRRFYLVTCMGRTAGHLAHGIGSAGGAQLILVPEEFPAGPIRLQRVADLVEAAAVKRLAADEPHGCFVLAEGLVNRMEPGEFAALQHLERDEHGHARTSEISLGAVLKSTLGPSLGARGLKLAFVAKELGYELRCEDPCAFDVAYTEALGVGAVQFLERGEGSALVTVQGGRIEAVPLDALQDPATGKTRVRLLDVASPAYRAQRSLEARLTREDLQGPRLGELARAAKLDEKRFAERFADLVEA
jgi:6-phosphofructokinase 1